MNLQRDHFIFSTKMKLPFLLMFVLAITVNPFSIQAQDDWIKYSVDEVLPFSVFVPGEMEASVQAINTAVGELNAHTYSYQGTEEEQNYLYLINCIEYPFGTFPKDSIDLISEYLESAVQSSTDKVAGELVYASDLENNGKLFRIKYNDGNAIIKGKSYIINDVFIVLQVFTVQGRSLNDEMDLFLDSFRVRG